MSPECPAGILRNGSLAPSVGPDTDTGERVVTAVSNGLGRPSARSVGVGDSPSGIYVNPRMDSKWNPAHYIRKQFFLNAGCAYALEGQSIDAAYVRRMLILMDIEGLMSSADMGLMDTLAA